MELVVRGRGLGRTAVTPVFFARDGRMYIGRKATKVKPTRHAIPDVAAFPAVAPAAPALRNDSNVQYALTPTRTQTNGNISEDPNKVSRWTVEYIPVRSCYRCQLLAQHHFVVVHAYPVCAYIVYTCLACLLFCFGFVSDDFSSRPLGLDGQTIRVK